jgi:hypothetical protein
VSDASSLTGGHLENIPSFLMPECLPVNDKMIGSCFNFAAFAYGVRVALQHISYIPTITYAVVGAGQAVLIAGIEKTLEFVFYLWPGKLLNDTVVHNEELLLLCIGEFWGPRSLPR